MNQQFWARAFISEEIGTVEEKLLKMEVGRETHGSQPGKFSLWRACEPEARPGTKEGQGLLKKEKEMTTPVVTSGVEASAGANYRLPI